MKIIVKNKDPMRAYKKLMKSLINDGWSKEIRAKEYYIGPSKKANIKHIKAINRKKREKAKQEKMEQKNSNRR